MTDKQLFEQAMNREEKKDALAHYREAIKGKKTGEPILTASLYECMRFSARSLKAKKEGKR